MIKVTEQEFFNSTGIELNQLLEKDDDSKHTQRFIDFNCREIDNYLRKYSPRLMRRGYDRLSDYQVETIKEACIQHMLNVYETGHTFIDEKGLPKIIPIAEDVKNILRPLIYRGL